MDNKFIDNLEKREYYISLFDFYSKLLTEKQQDYFKAYYFEDLSLSEIANNYGVSRNAIFDQLKKIYTNLEEYEEKLNLHKNFLRLESILNEFENLDNEEIKKLINKIRNIE